MTKFLLVLCLVAVFPVYVHAQHITISVDNVPLKRVMKLVEGYGQYVFAYRTEYLNHANRVSVHVKNGTIHQVMKQALKGLGLNYLIVGNMITVRPDTTAVVHDPALPPVEGQITNEAGLPISGASVIDNRSLTGTVTRTDGHFTLTDVQPNTVLTFSCVGYEPVTLLVKDRSPISIRLKAAVKDLDETVIIGYGKTSKRLNTGAIYKLGQADIARQPVANPLAVLQGRVPGLLITQSNGLPGSTYKVQLRGQSSIGIVPGRLPSNDPLFIIDGVPYAPNNNSVQTVPSGSALGQSGRSPFSLLSPGDIDQIEVLKDADATAIYGSRGANGVVIITTKKGKPGPPVFNFNINTGYSNITRYPVMLNTQQYVQMRREALQNDGLPLNDNNAPDLVSWDTTRYTDFKKMLIGGTAVTSNVQLSLSGGTNRLQYYIGTTYHHETTVFPGSLSDNRAAAHFNGHYQSKDSSLNVTASVIYTADNNKSILKDLTAFVNLPPNAPDLYDSDGKLNWQSDFSNPMAFLQQTYDAKTSNLLGNLDINYRIVRNLVLKTSIGYNRLQSDEVSIIPGSSQNPYTTPNPKGSSYFGKMILHSWIAEPQVEYTRYMGRGKIAALIGSTVQLQTTDVTTITASDFPNDGVLKDVSQAGKLTTEKLNTEYRYGGVFARLNGNLDDTYIINLTGRADGSSRFGPGKQAGVFWAAGAGWIFSNEPFVKNIPVISYGKLRASYGITGNDQIGDYKYLDQWQKVSGNYLGGTGVVPIQLADSNYSWEVNRKLEAAIDLGIFKDRVLVSVAWYRNRTDNQLIAYAVPAITGFTSYAARNSPALVQNTGWEITLQTKNKLSRDLQWSGNVSVTIPRNKLLAFPNLANSGYAGSLMVGQPLDVLKKYAYTGVNAATGLFTFQDINEDGKISYPDDSHIIGTLGPAWYGGIQSDLQYRSLQLDIFFEYRKQKAYSNLNTIYNNRSPGSALVNQPVMVLNHWQHPGDEVALQRFTTGADAVAGTAIDNFTESDGVIEDASFWRLKNIELSWMLPRSWLQKACMKNSRVYIQAQNLFTITRYKGIDPETQNMLALPPLRTIAAGIELSF
jgi:TonB-linked SusC/RagA family outer membrane protein